MAGFWRREDKWIEAVESQQRKGRKEDKTRHVRVCIFGHIKKRPLQPQRYMQLYVENSHFLSWSLHMFQTSPNVESQEIVTGMTGSLHVLLSFHNFHILLQYEMCLVFIEYKIVSLFYKDLSEGKTY
jgi:hypothetical protein